MLLKYYHILIMRQLYKENIILLIPLDNEMIFYLKDNIIIIITIGNKYLLYLNHINKITIKCFPSFFITFNQFHSTNKDISQTVSCVFNIENLPKDDLFQLCLGFFYK